MKLKALFLRFKWKFLLNFLLILLEAGIDLLFPLFIGFAIEGAIKGEHLGALQLGGLGLAIILIGGSRRYFDSRFYSIIYQKLGTDIISKIKGDLPSVKTARLGMIREIVEFMENSFPQLIAHIIGVLGVILIIARLNFHVFCFSLIATLLVFLVYNFTSSKTTRLNSAYNDEIEQQVDIIAANNAQQLELHLKDMMKWNIKLSDLEVLNFSISWIVLMAFLVLSIMLSVNIGTVEYGALFALIMYVFQYIGSVIALPFFYQEWLRLAEIKVRLESI